MVALVGCGPNQKIPQSLSGDIYRTKQAGNLVVIAPGMPAPLRAEAVAAIDSRIGRHYPHYIFGVMPTPIWFSLDVPQLATDFPGATIAASITHENGVIQLSWKVLPDGSLWLKDLEYELTRFAVYTP